MSSEIINEVRYFNGTRTSPEYSVEFQFEREFVIKDGLGWIASNWSYSLYWASAYILVIFGGQHLMKNRQPFKLRWTLFFWNSALAMFSIMGITRFLPEVLYVWRNFGFHWTVCDSSFLHDSKTPSFWALVFTLSKVPELIDTVFIVLTKKPLILLHYYHHASVLVFSWYCHSKAYGPGRWYIWMNYSVHSAMYTYYACNAYFAARSAKVRLPKSLAMLITTSQIVQMVAGFFVTLYSLLNLDNCPGTHKRAALSGLVVYGSYFVLFVLFFRSVYFGGGKFARSKATKDQKQIATDENDNIKATQKSSKKYE